MNRYFASAVVLLLLAMSIFAFALDTFGLLPAGASADFSLVGSRVPARALVAGWILEALALAVLFLAVNERMGSWWRDGLVTGWLAWIFRGPLLVLAVAGATRLPVAPWWRMTLCWFVLYSLCGLLLSALWAAMRPER